MRNVLVIQLARLGDLLQSKRLLLTLQEENNTQVHLCIDATLSSIAKKIYPHVIIHPLPLSSTQSELFEQVVPLLCELRRLQFSAVYNLNLSPFSFILARLFPPEIVSGYYNEKGQDIRSVWSQIIHRLFDNRLAFPINLVDLWAYFHSEPIQPGRVNPIARPAKTHKIGIVLSGQEAQRSLPAKTLAQILEAISKARQHPDLLLIGSKKEMLAAYQVLQELPEPIAARTTNLAGKTSLEDLLEILPECDLVVTPDTGIMHLAAHLGVPVQAFFLASAFFRQTGPYGLGHQVWQPLLPCAPCTESQNCRHQMQCLSAFAHPDFLEHLSGNPTDTWPNSLAGFVTGFDKLGLVFHQVDGIAPSYEDLADERRLQLAQHLKVPLTETITPINPKIFTAKDLFFPRG